MRSYLRVLAVVVLLLLAGCRVSRPIPTPTPAPVPPGGAILPAPAAASPTIAPTPTSLPTPLPTPGSGLSPLPTVTAEGMNGGAAPASPLATPMGATGAPPPAVQAAIAALAANTNLDASQVQVVSAEAVEWPDACLGVSQPGQMCAQVITPGYKIVLSTSQGQVEVHTDQMGRNVRIVTP